MKRIVSKELIIKAAERLDCSDLARNWPDIVDGKIVEFDDKHFDIDSAECEGYSISYRWTLPLDPLLGRSANCSTDKQSDKSTNTEGNDAD